MSETAVDKDNVDNSQLKPGAAVPVPEYEGDALTARYLLQVADDSMIYAQRLGEWISNAPQMEEDMALANVSLDLIGQVRALYTRVGQLDGTGRTEDDVAYFRDEREYYNVHLVEQPRGDFGDEMARMLWFSAFQYELYTALLNSSDEVLAGVAEKAIKEVSYHRDHATQWVLRLGDGTEESHQRMQAALDRIDPYVPELFVDDEISVKASEAGVGVLPSTLEAAARAYVTDVVTRATLTPVEKEHKWMSRDGRRGVHSQHLGFILAEMQYIPRSYPGAKW